MLLIKLSFLLSSAFAGNGYVVGNGGETVICSSATQNYEILYNKSAVLDVFEGSVYWSFHYKKLSAFRGQPLEQAFPVAVRDFFKRSPGAANQFLKYFSQFSKGVFLVEDSKLEDLHVWAPIASLHGCSVVQAAMQYAEGPGQLVKPLRIEIKKSLWKSLPTDQKIALLIHEYLEAWYFQVKGPAINFGVRDSVAFFLSDQAAAVPMTEWGSYFRLGYGERGDQYGG